MVRTVRFGFLFLPDLYLHHEWHASWTRPCIHTFIHPSMHPWTHAHSMHPWLGMTWGVIRASRALHERRFVSSLWMHECDPATPGCLATREHRFVTHWFVNGCLWTLFASPLQYSSRLSEVVFFTYTAPTKLNDKGATLWNTRRSGFTSLCIFYPHRETMNRAICLLDLEVLEIQEIVVTKKSEQITRTFSCPRLAWLKLLRLP